MVLIAEVSNGENFENFKNLDKDLDKENFSKNYFLKELVLFGVCVVMIRFCFVRFFSKNSEKSIPKTHDNNFLKNENPQEMILIKNENQQSSSKDIRKKSIKDDLNQFYTTKNVYVEEDSGW